MTQPINLANLKDATWDEEVGQRAARAILEAPAIQWCRKHDELAFEWGAAGWVCRKWDGPDTTEACVVVSARVVEVSE